MSLNPVAKDSLIALAEAVKPKNNHDSYQETAADFVNKLLTEPDKKRRRQMIKDFSARRADVAKFLEDNEDLIHAEAELALIGAAVGAKVMEREVSYKNGKRIVSTKEKHVPPNVAALNIYLKNKMPDKYSDKPQTEIEVEDVSDIKEALGYEENAAENTE